MATAKRISRNMAALSFAEIVSKLLQFVIMVYAARVLDKESFGIFSFALAFSFIAVIFADLGINTYLIREISRDSSKSSKYFGNAFITKIFLSVITFALIFGILGVLGYDQKSRTVVYLVWLFAIMSSFTELTYSIFRSFEKMYYDASIKVLRMLILIFLTFFVLAKGYGVVFFGLSFVITEVLIFLTSFALVYTRFTKPVFEFDFDFIKNLLFNSFPFGLSIVFGSIYFYIDSVMISKMRGPLEVAEYGAAYNLVLALLFIPLIYTTAIYPVMSRYYKKDSKALEFIYRKSWKYLYIIGIPISFGIFLLSDNIISLLYGTKYKSSVLALRILAWFVFLKFINYMLGTTLSSINRQKYRMYAQAGTALFNVALNLVLIPYIGFIGAAISTVLTEIFLFVLYYYYNSKHFFYYNFLPEIAKPLIASLTMAIFIIFVNLNIFVEVILSVMIYVSVVVLLRTFDKEDANLLQKVIKNEAI